jgi:DNA-binding NarL/FixJ family response regulator
VKRITVLLAEDHTVVRQGLRALLEVEGDIEVVGEAETGRQAVALTWQLRPAVVVMDIVMPVLNGLEATRRILSTLPATRVIMLSAHSDDAYVEQVIALGAAGYLLEQTSAHMLSTAVREVQKGNTFFGPHIAQRLHRLYGQSPARGELRKLREVRLSSRETEVLELVAAGQANKQVAAALGISVKTVEKHRRRLMAKLNIYDTAGLTRHAIAAAIIGRNIEATHVQPVVR